MRFRKCLKHCFLSGLFVRLSAQVDLDVHEHGIFFLLMPCCDSTFLGFMLLREEFRPFLDIDHQFMFLGVEVFSSPNKSLFGSSLDTLFSIFVPRHKCHLLDLRQLVQHLHQGCVSLFNGGSNSLDSFPFGFFLFSSPLLLCCQPELFQPPEFFLFATSLFLPSPFSCPSLLSFSSLCSFNLRDRPRNLLFFSASIGVQSPSSFTQLLLSSCLVHLGTSACFPFAAAGIAKLGFASASHVPAAGGLFDQ